MFTTLETLTLNGWHPDAGVWPMFAATLLGVAVLAAWRVAP